MVHIVQPDLWHSWEAVVSCIALSRGVVLCVDTALQATHHSENLCICAHAPSTCNTTMTGFPEAIAEEARDHISVKACAKSAMNG